MALRKDKKQVIGEDMTDDQIRRLLIAEPPARTDRDFHCLERAYRGLRAQDFERFLAFFIAEGRNPRATDARGRTMAEIMAGHANSADYLSALRAVGA
ncbi:MAG: PA4642 family protein [Gammaproteobacteria bacterium]